jgi:enamine deaminase RidA (YjgF/YER057c/UK114 family)
VDRTVTGPHEIINPESLPKPSGYSHAVVAAPGRTVYLAGQTGHRRDGSLADDLAEQFDGAAANLLEALRASRGEPEHLVSMQIFTTDLSGYVAASEAIGQAYRRHLGKHYVATALVEVKGLMDGAKVEIMAVAVVPESG